MLSAILPLPTALEPGVFKLPAINVWTVILTLVAIFSWFRFWHWMDVSPQTARKFMYELVTSYNEKKTKEREADLRKVTAICFSALVVFLLIKRQLMASAVTVAGAGTSDGTVDSLLWFIASLLGLGVLATKFRGDVARATRRRRVEIDNGPNNPVPMRAVPGPAPATEEEPKALDEANNPDKAH